MVSVATNGTLSSTGEKTGFVNLLTKEVGHTMIGFNCIIHGEALCAKADTITLKEVMQTVTKVMSCISARELHKGQFKV